MSMRVLLGSLRVHLDRIIDPQQGHRGLRSEPNTLDLAHGRLQHARLDRVPDFSSMEIQTSEPVLGLALFGLGGVMVRTQLGGQLGGIERPIDC